jgi:hypothetical protein
MPPFLLLCCLTHAHTHTCASEDRVSYLHTCVKGTLDKLVSGEEEEASIKVSSVFLKG